MGTEERDGAERGGNKGKGRDRELETGRRIELGQARRLPPPSENLGALCWGGQHSCLVSGTQEALGECGRILSFRVLEALPVLLTETGLGCVGSKYQGALPAKALLSRLAHPPCTSSVPESFSHEGHC